MATSERDIDVIRTGLGVGVRDDHQVQDERWSHLDFHFAKDLGQLVNKRVVNLIVKFTDEIGG